MIFHPHAAGLARLGFAVFALAEGSKVPPRGSRGFHDATRDWADIAQIAPRTPNANIGIATGELSGVTVIDIDPRNGGFDTIAALARAGLTLPAAALQVATPRGGRHVYLRYDPRLKSGSNRLGAGVDIKNDGGYVVAPPSYNAEAGASYRWLTVPRATGLPSAPDWIVCRCQPKYCPGPNRRSASPVGIDKLLEDIRTAPVGARNEVLNRLAFIAALNHSAAQIERPLIEAGLHAAGNDADERRKVFSTVRSAIRAAHQKGQMK